MNLDKVLIGISVLLGSILVIENMVTPTDGHILIWMNKPVWLVVMVSILIGFLLGYGVSISFRKPSDDDLDNEF